MIIYLVGFSISLMLIHLIEYKPLKSNTFIFFSFIALLIPCCIAGLRSSSIGTDVEGYALPMYRVAKDSDSFLSFLNTSWRHVYTMRKISDIELGFDITVYFSAKVFGSFQALLFIIEALTIIPIYKTLIKKRSIISPCLGMLTFYMIFYNVSLNILRQGICMAFVLLSYCYFTENKKIHATVLLIIAILFHTSGLLGLIIVAMYVYLKGNPQRKEIDNIKRKKGFRRWELYKLMILILASLGVTVFYGVIILVLQRLGLSTYARYLSMGTSILPGQIILRLPPFLFAMLEWKQLKKDPLSLFYIGIMIIELFLSQLSGNIVQTIRISLFFKNLFIIIIPVLYKHSIGRYKQIIRIGIPVYLIIYWVYNFVIQGSGETYPYLFYFS